MRGELTAEKETQVIQSIIGKGLEREELRDEILVQCVRQVNVLILSLLLLKYNNIFLCILSVFKFPNIKKPIFYLY